MLQVIPAPFGVFPIFNNLMSGHWQVLERNIHLNLNVNQFYEVIVCHLHRQSAKASGLSFIFFFFFLFFLNFKFLIFYIFFLFSLNGTIWETKFQTTFPLKVHIRFTPKIMHTHRKGLYQRGCGVFNMK